MNNYRLGLRSLIVGALFVLLETTPVLAGRPLVIDDAPPVAPGQVEIELGVSHSRPRGGGREQAWPVITLGYGLFERLEVGLTVQRINHDRRGEPPVRGFEDIHLGAKWNFFTESQTLPAASVALDVKLPTANMSKGLSTGKTNQSFTLILSKSYAPVGLHLNVSYLVVGSSKGMALKNNLSGGIAADYALSPKLAVVGEVFGASRPEIGGQNEAAFQLGLRYAVTPLLVLDAAAGRSLRAAGSNFQVTAGLTWTYNLGTFLMGGIKSPTGGKTANRNARP